jgi:hypothetical protein
MKFIQLFGKTPNHKKFSYTPRFYDPQEEERKERETRIRKELNDAPIAGGRLNEEDTAYRTRIAGSFRQAKKTVTVQADPSANMLRLIIILLLVVGLIGYLQFGPVALYAIAFLFIPFYLYLKYRGLSQKK